MGVNVEVAFQGNRLGLSLQRVRRAGLYGAHRRIALDSKGRECDSALMTTDGRFLFETGGLAGLYLDVNGDVADPNDTIPVNESPNLNISGCNDDWNPPELSGPIPADALLECSATAVYQVADLEPGSDLTASLASGDIYQLSLRTRGSSNDKTAFLLVNEHGAFVVKVQQGGFDFIGREAWPSFGEDSPNDIDNLDFEDWRAPR